MKGLEEPPRLLDGTNAADADLRAALRRTRARVPGPEQLAAMAGRLGVGPNQAPPPPGKGGATGPGGISAKGLALGAGGLAAAVAAVLILLGEPEATGPSPSVPQASVAPSKASAAPDEADAPAPAHRPRSEPARDAASSTTSAALPESNEPDPESAALPPTGDRAELGPERSETTAAEPQLERRERGRNEAAPHPTSRDRTTPPADPPPAEPKTEIELLGQARAALDTDPARALALTEAHRQRYPGGGFSQERELLAITALVRLGRSGDAARRAERFRAAYPASPYLKRIDRLTE